MVKSDKCIDVSQLLGAGARAAPKSTPVAEKGVYKMTICRPKGEEQWKLNFIELLAILQLITIQNSFDGNYIKPHAIKRLAKCNPIRLFICESQNFS